jgi:hypothetical protein
MVVVAQPLHVNGNGRGTMTTSEENEQAISRALLAKSESDYVLAEALFLNYKHGYFRLHGYRSVSEFLREHFRDKEQDQAARLHARSFQRLIREFKLAQEIPKFREAFDQIPRSNRRLIAQVITPENAEEWVARGRTMTYRELEELITKRPGGPTAGMVTKRLRFFPDQWDVFARAMEAAKKLLERDGSDPEVAEGIKLELVCMEFIGTYEQGGFRAFSTFECPGCGRFAAMERQPEQDLSDAAGKAVVFTCRVCGAGVVAKAFSNG